MKKKIIIPVIVCLLLVVGIMGFIIFNNRTVTTITLDINPSVEINLDRNEKVKSIIALNDDAKEIINNNIKGKSLDDTFEMLVTNLVEKGYAEKEKNLDIILYVDGKITNEDISKQIEFEFGKKDIHTEIIIIDNITKEDEKLAKKYNVSPAKVSYVNSITQGNDNITLENLVKNSVSELEETKKTGNYCEEGYILEGDWCLKEINRVEASEGEKCPSGYEEYKDICYELGGFKFTGDYKCPDNKEFSGSECIETIVSNAIPQYNCSNGELMKKGDFDPIGSSIPNETLYCVDKSTGKPPTLRCLNNPGHIMVNGKCYNGPAPLINGGCPDGGYKKGGWCYTPDNYDQYECQNGNIYEKSKGTYVELCPDTLTITKPTINGYHCDDERATLDNDKCVFVEKFPAEEIHACEEGFTLVDDGKCLNYNNILPKENGFICEGENERLKGNICIIYDMVPAKSF